MRAIMTAFPTAVLESAEKMAVAAAPFAPNPAGNANMSAYHREFLQNCVEEAMDDFCSDLRRQMWHLHYDMVRSFQLQQVRFTMWIDSACMKCILTVKSFDFQ